MNRQKAATIASGPDASWKDLYTAGGISILIYFIPGIIIPGMLFMMTGHDTGLDGAAILDFSGF